MGSIVYNYYWQVNNFTYYSIYQVRVGESREDEKCFNIGKRDL